MIKIWSSHKNAIRLIKTHFIHDHQFFSSLKIKASAFLKHSRFSQFMGLSDQFKNLEIAEQKQQKSSIRKNQAIIIIGMVSIFMAILLAYSQDAFRLKLSLFLKKTKLTLVKKQNRQHILKQSIKELKQFLIKFPYDYLKISGVLNNLLNSQHALIENQALYPQIQQICLEIVRKNFKAKNNRLILSAISTIIERRLLKNQSFSLQLAMVLIEGGSIKEMYLALKSIQNKITINNSTKKKIAENLQVQKQKNAKYFSEIYSIIPKQSIPQIKFKEEKLNKWSYYIEKILNR